jgi:hypothetical protein
VVPGRAVSAVSVLSTGLLCTVASNSTALKFSLPKQQLIYLYLLKNRTTPWVQFTNGFRVLRGLPRHCSASGMFAENRIDCDTTMRKRCASLVSRGRASANSILSMIASRLDCLYVNHCCSISSGIERQWMTSNIISCANITDTRLSTLLLTKWTKTKSLQ